MEMRKQGSEGQGTARSASKSPVRKQPREQESPPDQTTSGEEDLLQHAKHAGGEIVTQVQQRAGSQLNRQKEAAASELSQVANAVRRIRESLGGEENGTIARYAADYGEKAANRIEQFSNYIREQDPKQLVNDVQNFGRRRPALLIGGAFLLGFAGARLIKSSMDSSYQPTAANPS